MAFILFLFTRSHTPIYSFGLRERGRILLWACCRWNLERLLSMALRRVKVNEGAFVKGRMSVQLLTCDKSCTRDTVVVVECYGSIHHHAKVSDCWWGIYSSVIDRYGDADCLFEFFPRYHDRFTFVCINANLPFLLYQGVNFWRCSIFCLAVIAEKELV